jgi:Ser/Thr protein kinase RdoA (MazF antagonist)
MNAVDSEIPLSAPMRRSWLSPDERSVVYRKGDVVLRETGPWAVSVHSFLRHLAEVGFDAAPKVIGNCFADDGRETLSYIDGEVINPKPWGGDGIAALGQLLRDLHDASASFVPQDDAIWPPFFGRDLGGEERIISHCDMAPWNVVSKGGLPIGLIDWEYAGLIDSLVEVAQAAWLNVRLFGDDVAKIEGL